jgi:hypothetical protein
VLGKDKFQLECFRSSETDLAMLGKNTLQLWTVSEVLKRIGLDWVRIRVIGTVSEVHK